MLTNSLNPAQLELEYLTEDADSGSGNTDSGGLKLPFDRLVLPEGHKDMILSLITQHFRDKESARSRGDRADIVRGKGMRGVLTICVERAGDQY